MDHWRSSFLTVGCTCFMLCTVVSILQCGCVHTPLWYTHTHTLRHAALSYATRLDDLHLLCSAIACWGEFECTPRSNQSLRRWSSLWMILQHKWNRMSVAGKQRNAGNTKRQNPLEGLRYKKGWMSFPEFRSIITNLNILFIRGFVEQNLNQQASVRTSRLSASKRKWNVSLTVMKNNKCVNANITTITQQIDLKINLNPSPPVTWQEIKPLQLTQAFERGWKQAGLSLRVVCNHELSFLIKMSKQARRHRSWEVFVNQPPAQKASGLVSGCLYSCRWWDTCACTELIHNNGSACQDYSSKGLPDNGARSSICCTHVSDEHSANIESRCPWCTGEIDAFSSFFAFEFDRQQHSWLCTS